MLLASLYSNIATLVTVLHLTIHTTSVVQSFTYVCMYVWKALCKWTLVQIYDTLDVFVSTDMQIILILYCKWKM